MILVFDLDDTLYEEMSFVRSGFRQVAGHISALYRFNEEEVFQALMEKLKEGRGSTFNKVLDHYGILSKKLVKECLNIYRYHKPDIHLYDDAILCLKRFALNPKYIVTDGNKLVQHNKIRALGLEKYIKRSYITHRYGIRYAKPSDYVFQLICRKEKAGPSDILYIADNPLKDFIGIKPKGFRTVRILRGNFKDTVVNTSTDADRTIHSLDEITENYLNSFK